MKEWKEVHHVLNHLKSMLAAISGVNSFIVRPWGLNPGSHIYLCSRQVLYHGIIAPALFLPFIWRQRLIEFLRLGSGVRQALSFQLSCLSFPGTGNYRPVLPSATQVLFLTAKESEQNPPEQRTVFEVVRYLLRGIALFFLHKVATYLFLYVGCHCQISRESA